MTGKIEERVPINKGNYSMDTPEREARFHEILGRGWENEYRSYRAAWERNPKSHTVSEYPLLVDIELASVCNLKCPMCYTISPEFRQHVKAKLMDVGLFRKIIDEIAGYVPSVRLSLRGESFLHKKVIDCIRYAKGKGIPEVSSLTNGAKLKGHFMEEVIDAGIDWITVSIDGVGETYERIRKPIRFDEIVGNLRAIKEYKKRKGLERPVIKVQGVWPAIREDPQKYYDIFAPLADLVAFNPLIDYRTRDEKVVYVDDFVCPQQYQRLVIGADGLVMKCSNDEENREVIGDTNIESVHEIWHGEKMRRVREQMLKPRGFMQSPVCRQCYLPRKTVGNEVFTINGQQVTVRNYVNRSQVIGE
ncbi:radical SAM/SPASM domain-containing protein [Alcanivorax sp.]|uniref:radical SAM/SPASM domain-containing protein n=1 Tax=Alcanivorax sp. TaxID=1872427 RepID=UPI0025875155|nr:radical SAM/SPASM domain-containing protein [Alcanivorax sp.]